MRRSTSSITWIYVCLLAVTTGATAIFAAQPPRWGLFVATALLSMILCVLVWRRGDVDVRVVVAGALIFRLAFLWLPPILSDDAYRYVWDGLLQTQGVNPFLYVPEDPVLSGFQNEPIFSELNSASYHTVYPPVSQYVFRVGAWFYDSGWETSYYVIKVVFAGLEFGAVLLLARVVSGGALVLYAWNPLVLITGAGQAHGEAAMLFFLLLTWYLAERKKVGWASVSLAFAGWIKLYPFLLFPFLWRRFGWPAVWPGLAAAVLLALPFADPAVPAGVAASLDLYYRLFEFNAGPYYGVKHVLYLITGEDWSKQIGPAFRATFLLSIPLIYVMDRRSNWSLRRAFLVMIGTFFVLSTTIHPWYLLPVLALAAPMGTPSWHWLWLGAISIGTYLLYVDGPYWTWVHLGWWGWAALGAVRYRSYLLEPVMRRRAQSKASLIEPLLPTTRDRLRILDLGAGEGYVAEELSRRTGAWVQLADVTDMNRTSLPHQVYDGNRLPYPPGEFDATLLVYVLHHARSPEDVVREALRVSRRRVVVVESSYRWAWERPILVFVDRLANRARSGGRMSDQATYLRHRTFEEWRALFDRLDVHVIGARVLGGLIHHRSVFVLAART